MKYTAGQREAMTLLDRFLRERTPGVFKLAGYAGTGKSTIMSHIAKEWNLLPLAPTAKAALVLRDKGMGQAQTLHGFLYRPPVNVWVCPGCGETGEPEGECEECDLDLEREPIFAEVKDNLRTDYDAVVIDEASMVESKEARNVAALGLPIIAVGDGFQLPPVKGQPGFDMAQPDYQLTEVTRAGKDSPITALATRLRDGQTSISRRDASQGHVDVAQSRDISRRIMPQTTKGTQWIARKNRTVHAYNERIRQRVWGDDVPPLPVKGDRVVCRKNAVRFDELNGQQFWVKADSFLRHDDDGRRVNLYAEAKGTRRRFTHWADPMGFERPNDFKPNDSLLSAFMYAYAITCHTAQGSEWGKVVVVNEYGPDHSRWLYTAVTRAKRKLTITF